MRLRSSQFVFLLLLVCSVQSREGLLPQVAGAVAEQAGHGLPSPDTAWAAVHQVRLEQRSAAPLTPATRLTAARAAIHRRPWSMRGPALSSAAVASFTGFLRA